MEQKRKISLILASASPRRKELLKLAGYKFEISPSDAEESYQSTAPSEIVMELAHQKAEDIAMKMNNVCIVIGADTIVVYGKEMLGKPADANEASQMLQMLSGKTHQVYTGVSLQLCSGGKITDYRDFYESTDVTFFELTDEQIGQYIDTGEPFDKAGAYAIQGKAGVFVKEIRGDYDNVVGLPVARLNKELRVLLSNIV